MRGKEGGSIKKAHGESFGGDTNVHHLDCDDSFIRIYCYQHSSSCTH